LRKYDLHSHELFFRAIVMLQIEAEQEAPMAGPFCRWESLTQTPAIALVQVRSGEIWGDTPKNGGLEPTVQAYPWPLAAARRGIEFTTDILPHHPMSSPIEARWYLTLTPGVLRRQKNGVHYACITAAIDNRQP